jgi:hypothetical protein
MNGFDKAASFNLATSDSEEAESDAEENVFTIRAAC